MKINLVVAAVAAFTAFAVVQGETPSLRRLDEPGAPQPDEVAMAGRPCNKWNTWCQGKPHAIVSDPKPEGRSADAEKLAAGAPQADVPSGIITSPFCARNPNQPSCKYLNSEPAARNAGAEQLTAERPGADDPTEDSLRPAICKKYPMYPICNNLVNVEGAKPTA